ncbi:Similar to RH17: DEAD-box ATP-dependent RNA helicase 17 (Arabidopsis thaliana) [Cotesia congregata]|uniref:ATP-dependent RNA helicase n=1 Tax=Cotesia congregata TaxID=51543 RepID=A0A8J2HGF5_COTCN|nr:Similar to RH17: DEAD-box ATP-dependent RNA helicase 17 (Arabidopsis thaliana) [Cotesia congregata]
MTLGDMSLMLNISSASSPKTEARKGSNKNTTKKSIEEKKVTNKNEDSKKRVKQKSLAAIVAQNRNRVTKLAATNADSNVKLPGILKNKNKNKEETKSKDKEENKSSELITFVKPSSTGLKTILAKPKVDKASKSLADIYNTKSDDKSSKVADTFNKKSKSDSNLLLNSTVTDESREKKTEELPVKNFTDDRSNFKNKRFGDNSRAKNNNEKKYDKERVYNNKPSGKISSLFGNNPDIPKIGQRLVKPVNEPVFSKVTFAELGIHPHEVSNLEKNMEIFHATIVQQKSIPKILSGKDILVRSQTGSGKTLAYALPIVESLQKIRPKLSRNDGLKALVVVPTRELALQTYECFIKLIRPFTWIVPGYLVGGEKRKAEKARLRRGCTILVATPGRLLDHIKNTEALRVNDVKCLVLDEADRMLDMGYEKDISEIVSALNVSQSNESSGYDPMKLLRQNSVKKFDDEIEQEPAVQCVEEEKEEEEEDEEEEENKEYHSATDSDNDSEDLAVKKQKAKKLNKEKNKSNDISNEENKSTTVEEGRRQIILLSATLTNAVEKLAGLTMTNPVLIDAAADNLKNSTGNMSDINEDLIVPQNMVDYYTNILSSTLTKLDDNDNDDDDDDEDEGMDPLIDVEFFKLHGSMTQKERTEVFKTFRLSRTGVLLSTYTGPLSARDYVHRIGRTARAGTSGTAIIFLTPPEIEFIRMLESRKIRIKQEDMDEILAKLMGPLSRQHTIQEAATSLQNKFENFLLNDSKLYNAACKAYSSWVRFYTSYPREMREIFNRQTLHLGHYAKSFALRDPPQRIGSVNKQIREKNPEKPVHNNRLSNNRPERIRHKQSKEHGLGAGALKRSRMLNVSEYGDGLAPMKKSKK